MIVAKDPTQASEGVFMNPPGFLQVTKFSDHLGQVVHGPKCVGMVLAQYAYARVHGWFLQLVSFSQSSNLTENTC